MEENRSLFERIGGMNAVDAAVDIFYTKVLADESINHFFLNTDMKTQAEQTSQRKGGQQKGNN